jgi:iron(III) transport system permease protein
MNFTLSSCSEHATAAQSVHLEHAVVYAGIGASDCGGPDAGLVAYIVARRLVPFGGVLGFLAWRPS